MRKIVLTSLLSLFIGSMYGQQTFDRIYQYWNYGEGNEVFSDAEGYILAGFGKRDTTNYLFVLKTDFSGDTLWVRHFAFGHRLSYYPWIQASFRDTDGNTYFTILNTEDSLNLVKFNPQWNLVWKKSTGPDFRIQHMVFTEDSHIIGVGRDNAGYCIMKLDTTGVAVWRSQNIWHNPFFTIEFSSLLEMPDKSIVIISSWMNSTYYSISPSIITRYSPTGDSISSVQFCPGSGYFNITDTHLIGEELLSICRGNTYSQRSSLIRHRVDGTVLMDKVIEPEMSFDKMLITPENRIVAKGFITDGYMGRIVLHGLTLEGDSLWTSFVSYSRDLWVSRMKLCSDNGVLLAGMSSLTSWPEGYPFLLRTDSLGRISPLSIPDTRIDAVHVYPNPATDMIVFETPGKLYGRISIRDACNRMCSVFEVKGEKTVFSTAGLAPGIYVYSFDSNKGVFSGKLIIKTAQ